MRVAFGEQADLKSSNGELAHYTFEASGVISSSEDDPDLARFNGFTWDWRLAFFKEKAIGADGEYSFQLQADADAMDLRIGDWTLSAEERTGFSVRVVLDDGLGLFEIVAEAGLGGARARGSASPFGYERGRLLDYILISFRASALPRAAFHVSATDQQTTSLGKNSKFSFISVAPGTESVSSWIKEISSCPSSTALRLM